MPLYFVEHHHTAAACPTQQPEMLQMLGKHVTQPSADKFGVKIIADVVHPGEHWMNMVLEAPDKKNVDEFVQPFGQVGTVEVKEVTTCEQVVSTAKC
ncbi:MAG: sulfite oxidase [Chloroflexota bacterium]|nr:sulfite oxidase [Chloroflexota bacterium]